MRTMEVHNMKTKLTTLGVSLVLFSTIFLGLMGTAVATAPPVPEQPTGPEQAEIGELVFISVDPVLMVGHNVFYNFNWSDGYTTGWLGPYPPDWNDEIEAQHAWDVEGIYQVRVQAKNETSGEISDWSQPHDITIGQTAAEPGPLFAIVGVTGGTSITAQIQNKLAPSKYVNYTIEIAGGQISGFHTHKFYNDTIFIPSGDTAMITVSGPFRGLGSVKVTVTAKCAGESVATGTYRGFLLFFYILNLKEI
jgi:hypothetical protein